MLSDAVEADSSDSPTVGVVLVNLGTPDEPALPAVRRYLREFLSDRRIVNLPPLFWKPILETHIMYGHARLSAAKYASVWYESGSPLLVHTREQAAALAARLSELAGCPVELSGAESGSAAPAAAPLGNINSLSGAGSPADGPAAGPGQTGAADPSAVPSRPGGAAAGQPALTVAYAMRYGNPSLGSVLAGLQAAGIGKLLIVPMYPQYSTTTTATVIDALSSYLGRAQNHPETRWIRSWAADPGYIEALAQRIEASWAERGRPDFARGDKLLLSFHGIPVSVTAGGDPYPKECETTADLLRERLGLGPEHCLMTYQSKFGHGEWLTPATIETVGKLGELGVARLDVCCPGFAVDCLETLEEIGLLNRDEFERRGGGQLVRIPCLNDFGPWIDALAALVWRHVAGWTDALTQPDPRRRTGL
ncbi:MAG: ferrochelatase [Propionibacteriaceae bacterium]|nr:ferrochelatase [Propionibacteriaceae bacterium]